MKYILYSLILGFFLPLIVFAQQANVMNPLDRQSQYLGNPEDLGVPGSGIIPEPGVIPEFNPGSLTFRKLDTRLIVNQGGVGDQCKAGNTPPLPWSLDVGEVIDTKNEIISVVQKAAMHDTRLRSIRILDDQIDMHYLQPAYKWGFVPTNYYVHVSANGNTLRISIQKPKWLGNAKSEYAQVTNAFSMYTPEYLNSQVVSGLENAGLIERDAKMIEVISAIMYRVDVSPFSNSFFVCYIMPFLFYILLIGTLLGIGLWFLIRKLRRGTGFLVKQIRPITFEHEDDDVDRGVKNP